MSQNIIKIINNNLEIASVISSFIAIQKKGNNYIALCPFHGDSNPSLIISNQKRIFKCFSCNVAGGIIDFVMKFNKINYFNALKLINEKFSLNLELKNENYTNNVAIEYNELEKNLINANSISSVIFKLNLQNELTTNTKLKLFFHKRKLTQEIIQQFDIGFSDDDSLRFKDFLINKKKIAKDVLINASLLTENENLFFANRVIFPIKNEFNHIVGFSGRIIDNNDNVAKYLNSSQNSLFSKSKILFNFYQANNYINDKKEIIICEGFMDVIALYKINIKNVVALMGTALTNEHIRLLKDKKIILWLDGDRAGKSATKKSILTLLKNKISVEIINNKTNLDPDEILNLNGENELKKILEMKISPFEFLYNDLTKFLEPKNFSSVNNFVKEFSEYLIFASEQEKAFFIAKSTNEFEIPENFFNLDIKNKLINEQFKNHELSTKKLQKIKFTSYFNETICSILLVKEIEQIYIKEKDEVYFFNNEKKILNQLLQIPNLNERISMLKKNSFFTDNYAKTVKDWKSIKKRNNNFYKIILNQKAIKQIAELEKWKKISDDIDEHRKIDKQINSIYFNLMKITKKN
ncbi:DNA primase [[Mycoplasma] collis]|uniref:DNA primase n=1 Tax=[Mycoplasma] collis TaxID=2127 RepID=UPI00068DB70A|nr:DNA primase [[Mycoplasma] collis]